MVSAESVPNHYQLRRSNGITIQSVVKKYNIEADILHLQDDYEEIRNELSRCIRTYDILLMSGGVSMGKFDYLPEVCEELGIEKLFHKIKQRPGKPFWFGKIKTKSLFLHFRAIPYPSSCVCTGILFPGWKDLWDYPEAHLSMQFCRMICR